MNKLCSQCGAYWDCEHKIIFSDMAQEQEHGMLVNRAGRKFLYDLAEIRDGKPSGKWMIVDEPRDAAKDFSDWADVEIRIEGLYK